MSDDLILSFTPEAWTARGACRGIDTEAFFPERGGDVKLAKSMCATCDVATECLDYALRTSQTFGIWGGTSERERRSMRRQIRLNTEGAGVRGPLQALDYARVARIARDAFANGEPMSHAVARELGVGINTARHYVSTARRAGHDVPHARQVA